MADVRQMGDRELDAWIVQYVLLWRQRVTKPHEFDAGRILWSRPEGGKVYTLQTIPRFSLDRNACAEMEAEIARRGLRDEYINALCSITRGVEQNVFGYVALWLIATATPRQRCEAAYLALEGTHDA